MKQVVYGVGGLFMNPTAGGGSGDLFNGLLSLASLSKKTQDKSTKLICTPESKFDVVSLFKNENIYPISKNYLNSDHIFEDIHVSSLHRKVRKVSETSGVTVWDYFLLRGITENDIIKDFYIDGNINSSIQENDIIIFPSAGGGGNHGEDGNKNLNTAQSGYLPHDFYLKFIEKHFPNHGKIYWNKETNPFYTHNIPNDGNMIQLNFKDIIATIFHRNPIVIGHRSGIFDMLFHILPPDRSSKMICFYDLNIECHHTFRFTGSVVPESFRNYSEKRKYYSEIGIPIVGSDKTKILELV